MTLGSKMRKLLLWALLATLIGGIVWAVNDQSNKLAGDAANMAVKNEMAEIETTMVKPKKDDNINWTEINRYKRELDRISAEYQKLVDKAALERNTGGVTAATSSAGFASADKFNKTSQEMARAWEKYNCKTRARVTREAGAARLKNAQMAFSAQMNSDDIAAYNEQREQLSAASKENFAEIKATGSEDSISRLKSTLMPQLQQMSTQTATLIGAIAKQIDEIRRAVGGDVGAIAGCAKQVMTGDGPAGMLKPLMGLLNMTKGIGGNISTMMTTLASL